MVALIQGRPYCNEEIIIIDEEVAMSGTLGVTPQMFGAKGDGVSNDTKAVQAAIDFAAKNENNVVFIPEGVYCVRNLRLRENVILSGQGANSILKADKSCKTWDGIIICNDLDSVVINNITFDGNKPIVPGDAHKGTVNMWVDRSKNINITDCIFQNNWYLGICLQNSQYIKIVNNKFINLDCGVITTSGPSSDIEISGNYFDGADYSEPIAIYGTKPGYHKNITIVNNVIKNHTKGSGIGLRAVDCAVIRDNIIENCCTGIYCESVEYNGEVYVVNDVAIENNTITNMVCEGVLLNSFSNSKIMSNIIENAGSYSIFTHKVVDSTISDNTIINDDISKVSYHGYAMTLNGVTASIVINNQIKILDLKNSIGRNPISIGSSSVDNIFENNNFSRSTKELYVISSNDNTIK